MKKSGIKLYKKGYSSPLIRGVEDKRPWDLEKKIKSFLTLESTMLDIGSGDARKLLNICNSCKKIFAVEPSLEMRNLASLSVQRNNINNIDIVDGVADNLPFQDSYFDIVTSMLAPWDEDEVFRVLKSGGYFINEAVGSNDKIKFKKVFGKDKNGDWRGSLIQTPAAKFIMQYQERLSHKFVGVEIIEGYWDTYYTREGLIELCENTPTIKDFNVKTDHKYLELIEKKLTVDKGIKVTQNRLLIIAQKP